MKCRPPHSKIAVILAVCLLAATSACGRTSKPDQIIPLDLSGPHPTAMLSIGKNAPIKVIFDTGAGGSLIAKKLADQLGLPSQGDVNVASPGATAPVKASFVSIPSAHLGGAELEDGQFVAMELPPRIVEYDGVVSPNAFSGRLLRFEFANSRVVVTDKTQASIPAGDGFAYGGEAFHSLPAADIDVAGVTITAHLDSGSRYGLNLPVEFAKKIPLKGPLVPTDPVHMIGGEHAAYMATINGAVHIGPLTLTDPQVMFIEGIPPFGNVGIQLLKQLTLVLDPESKRSWLLPSAK
jgi:hypothetical protein